MLMSNPRVPTNPYNTEKPCRTSWHKRDISVPFKCFFTLENMPLLKLFNPICTYKKTKMFHYKRESVEMCVCCRLFISSTMFSVNINMQGTDGILIQPTVIHVHSILFNMCTEISVTCTFLFCFLTYQLMLCIHKYERLFIPQIQWTIFHKFVILLGLINSTLRPTCTLKQAQLKYAGCRPTCTVHKVPSHI